MRGSPSSKWYEVGQRKVDTTPEALAAKVQIREKVLAELGEPAHVLDLFCGAEHTMHGTVWNKAASYVGCDARPWKKGEPGRFVCDNRLLLRCLDLSRFNVFDLDAYGSPWEQMIILAARRTWAPGERGAVVLTDGCGMALRVGGIPHALAQMVGMERLQGIPSVKVGHDLQGMALKAWVTRARVEPLKMWIAEGKHLGPRGRRQGDMLYMAVVFQGVKA